MLKSRFNEEKITPNQYAKELIEDKIYELFEYGWEDELSRFNHDTFKEELTCTERELQQIREQFLKRAKGVLKYLGVDNQYTNEVA